MHVDPVRTDRAELLVLVAQPISCTVSKKNENKELLLDPEARTKTLHLCEKLVLQDVQAGS